MLDGSYKMVQDVAVEDAVMGDDGTSRTVMSTTTGREKMARVTLTKGDTFVCNWSHVLSLKLSLPPAVFYNSKKQTPWIATWHKTTRNTLDGTVDTITKKTKAFPTKEEAEKHIEVITSDVVMDDDTIDIAVKHLMDRTKVTQATFNNLSSYHPGPLEFAAVDDVAMSEALPIAPYALGYWLGDGCGGTNAQGFTPNINFVSNDPEVVAYFDEYLPTLGLETRYSHPYTYFIRQSNRMTKAGGNPFRSFVIDNDLGFAGKRILDAYKYGSVETRLEVLAGLLDADGHLHNTGFDLTLKSEVLIADAAFVARSLGFRVSVQKDRYISKLRTANTYNGKKGEPLGTYKRISIYGDTTRIPMKIARKKPNDRVINKKALREYFTLTELPEDDYYGFRLGGNHRFVIGEGMVVTHNSFAVDQAKEITVSGAMMNLTHLTTHGMNGGDDFSDCSLVMEELPLDMIGVDKYGNTTAADPHLKARMASGISTTLSQDTSADPQSAGERKSRLYTSRCMVSHIFISNDMLPPVNTAIMQRFIPYVMRKLSRDDADGQDRSFSFSTESDTGRIRDRHEEVFHGARLQHSYLFIWEKAIEAGVMPDIGMDTAHIVCRWIFDELAKRKVPVPSRRHKLMLLDLCRQMQMYYGVDMEFLSEYAHSQRAHSTGKMPEGPRPRRPCAEQMAYDAAVRTAFEEGNNEPFQPWMLEGLVKWGVVTQEIIVFAISLLEFLWVPRTRTDIARAAAVLARVDRDIEGIWTPIKGKTSFRREEPDLASQQVGQWQPQPQPQQPPAPPALDIGNTPSHDFRYIELVGHTTVEIAQKIRRMIADPPSENDVMSTVNAMANDYIVCKRKHFVTYQRESEVIDPDTHAPMLEDYYALEDVPDASEELIPCAIIDTLSDKISAHTSRRRVSIAIDVIQQNFGTALAESIQSALGHRHQQDRDFITAFPYEHTEVRDGMDGRQRGRRTTIMHQVFQTIPIRRTDARRYVLNTFGRTDNEIRVLASRGYGGISAEEYADIKTSQAPVFAVEENLDHTALIKYWINNGVSVDGAGPAYSPLALEQMQYVRQAYPMIFKADLQLKNYPNDWVEFINKRHKVSRKMAAANTDPGAVDDHQEAPTWGEAGQKIQPSRDRSGIRVSQIWHTSGRMADGARPEDAAADAVARVDLSDRRRGSVRRSARDAFERGARRETLASSEASDLYRRAFAARTRVQKRARVV